MKIKISGLLIVSALLSGCGASNGLPNFGELAAKIPPAIATSSAVTTRADVQYFSSPAHTVGRAITYNTDGWVTNLDALKNVFGTNLSGVNTQIAVQLAQLESLGDTLKGSHYSDTDGFINCTETISSTTATAPAAAFPGDSIFWTQADSGKYTCLIQSQSGGYNYLTMVGREALTTPVDGCAAANSYNYYVVYGYSNGTATDGGYQLQRIFINGCTNDMKIAMALAAIYPSQNNFVARFEMTGNPDTRTFQIRTAKLDGDTGNYFGNFVEAAGVSQTVNGTAGYFPAKIRDCSGATCNSIGTTKTMCIKTGTTEGSYTQEAVTSSTDCDAHETAFNEVANSTNGFEDTNDVNLTWLDFSLKSTVGL